MIYLGGVTLGYFNLYPVGFQPKEEKPTLDDASTAPEETATIAGSRLSSARRPLQWPLHGFL